MAEKLDEKELVSREEIINSNMIMLDTLTQLLMEKGIITKEEFFTRLKEVQYEYEKRKSVKG